MTPQDSSGRSQSSGRKPRGGRRSPSGRDEGRDLSGRRLAATLAGVIAGALAFAVLLFAGLLLYQRLWGNSTGILAVLGVLFGVGGLYAGWIAATMVFAALRGGGDA